jgi:hypothetical protein
VGQDGRFLVAFVQRLVPLRLQSIRRTNPPASSGATPVQQFGRRRGHRAGDEKEVNNEIAIVMVRESGASGQFRRRRRSGGTRRRR